MKAYDPENKQFFLIASSNPERLALLKLFAETHIHSATIFLAIDGPDVLSKIANAPPQLVILDQDLTKISTLDVAKKILQGKPESALPVIIVSEIPEEVQLADELVTGYLQFVESVEKPDQLVRAITKALNTVGAASKAAYTLKFIHKGDYLFKENDKSGSVYILKQGGLEAVRQSEDAEIVLGQISAGEFIGEMAHFNSGTRSASVRALKDSELIEITAENIDRVLFTKPAWAKALVATLSKRLKHSNDRISE